MKRLISTILTIIAVAAVSMPVVAQNYHLRHDTVYVYESWEAIFDQTPDAMLLNPDIEAFTPYDIDFTISDREQNRILHEETVALTVGDSIWLINTNWLRENFKGDCKKMIDWVPLYFSAKVAFIEWTDYKSSVGMSILGSLLGDPELFYDDPESTVGDLYMLDFDEGRVYKVDHKRLSKLLEPYHDLKVRYEGMKDYKKPYMIRTFFLEYINRLNDDPTVPFLI